MIYYLKFLKKIYITTFTYVLFKKLLKAKSRCCITDMEGMEYIEIFLKELGSQGWFHIILWGLSGVFSAGVGMGIRACIDMLRYYTSFDIGYLWYTIIMMLLSFLCGGFLFVSPMPIIRLVMIVWTLFAIFMGCLIPMNRD